jgi:hypothetical protein
LYLVDLPSSSSGGAPPPSPLFSPKTSFSAISIWRHPNKRVRHSQASQAGVHSVVGWAVWPITGSRKGIRGSLGGYTTRQTMLSTASAADQIAECDGLFLRSERKNGVFAVSGDFNCDWWSFTRKAIFACLLNKGSKSGHRQERVHSYTEIDGSSHKGIWTSFAVRCTHNADRFKIDISNDSWKCL